MSTGVSRFTDLLRHRLVQKPVLWGVIGRLPLYLVSLSLTLHLLDEGLGYASAGIVLAAYTVGTATIGPVIARRIDRHGQPTILVLTAIVHPLALVGSVYAVSGPWALELLLTFVAGGTIPPVSQVIRALWSTLPLSRDERSTAYSLESILAELFVIGGPLLLSLLMMLGDAGTATVVGGVLAGLGGLGLATTKASRQWKPEPAAHRDLLGALRSRPLLILLLVIALSALSLGVLNLALAAFTEHHGSAGDVGFLFGASGVGGAIGGLWFGSRSFAASKGHQLPLACVAFTLAAAAPLPAWDTWSMAVAMALLGSSIAPLTAILYELVGSAALQGTVSEAFTWVLTATTAGGAVGSQLAGVLIGRFGWSAGFVLAVLSGCCATLLAFAVRHRMVAVAEAGPSRAVDTDSASASVSTSTSLEPDK
ncbi:MFS transporter [Streptomyces sp. CA-251247]|uniref:MFS transporter n=1 Tax=Streptomyces sp. CA-251247 TaxID=3240062 RepID=UPI003D8FB325